MSVLFYPFAQCWRADVKLLRHQIIVLIVVISIASQSNADPGFAALKQIDICSNNHRLRFNGESISQFGARLPDIEWTVDSPHILVMHAAQSIITGTVTFQTKGVEVGSTIAVTGTAKNYYSMDFSGELFLEQFDGFDNDLLTLPIKSARSLPESLERLDDEIVWTLTVTAPSGDQFRISTDKTSTITCYLVFSDNHHSLVQGAEPTPARIEHSYRRYRSATGELSLGDDLANKVHALNRQVSRYYNPANHFTNETCWNVPETWGVRGGGASCISISRYCQHVLQVLGFPGKVEVDAFWAKPEQPFVAEGGGTDAPDIFSTNRSGSLKLYLVDNRNSAGGGRGGYGGMNNYEGALIYTDMAGEIYYFPGGTQHIYRNKDQILSVFRSLAWARYDYRAHQWQVVHVIAAYQNGVGSVASTRASSSAPPPARRGSERRSGLFGRIFSRG